MLFRLSWFMLLLAGAATTGACHAAVPPPPAESMPVTVTRPLHRNVDGCVDRFDAGADYFPDKVEFRHSTQLSVAYHGHYKVLTLTPAVGTAEVLQYALVQCGTPPPSDFPAARIVTVPMRRFTTSNHSILSAITRLGLEDRLVGVSSKLSITEPTIRALAMERAIAEVGSGTHSNIELAMAVAPDVHFTFYSAYPQSNMHPRLWEMGVRALPLADHMEPTPLGRAEWLLYLAALANREAEATAAFATIERRYEALRARTRDVRNRPTVMMGWSETRDVWDLRGGDNNFAALIHDAGGEYFWREGGTSSYVRPPYESVLYQSSYAMFWIGGPNRIASHRDLVEADARHAYVRPVLERRVFALDRGGVGTWTYPWVDQSLDRPDAILADLISVLHPDLTADDALVYVRALE
jgi:iron complex transport system substrate-binding protein